MSEGRSPKFPKEMIQDGVRMGYDTIEIDAWRSWWLREAEEIEREQKEHWRKNKALDERARTIREMLGK